MTSAIIFVLASFSLALFFVPLRMSWGWNISGVIAAFFVGLLSVFQSDSTESGFINGALLGGLFAFVFLFRLAQARKSFLPLITSQFRRRNERSNSHEIKDSIFQRKN